MKPLITLALCLVLMGCNKMQSQVSFAPVPAEDPVQKLKERACEWDPADYELRTHLLAFEMYKKNQLQFGFNLMNGFFKAFGLNIKIEKGQMTFRMDLSKPQDSKNELINAIGKGEFKSSDIGLSLDFSVIHAGFQTGKTTPLSNVVENGLMNTLDETKKQMAQLPLEWTTHISEINGTKARIPVGLLAGVRKGDEFAIYNVVSQWEGAPCQSHFYGEYKTSETPVAMGVVTDLNESVAFIELSKMNEPVDIGSRVEISKLVGKDRQPLLKSIRLTGVTSEPITLEDGTQVDMQPYVSEIIKPVVTKSGFYLRQ